MFWNNLHKFTNNIALIETKSNESITYLNLINDILSFNEELKYTKNKICLILMGNDYESIISYLGILNSNNIAMLLSANISEIFLEGIIEKYSPDFIISSNEREIKSYKKKDFSSRIIKLNIYHSKFNQSCKKAETKLMLSTSGSTGSSKFVRLSAENIQSNAKSIANYLRISQSDVAITSLPLNYSFGLSILNSHLLAGAKIVLTAESVTQKGFWDVFKKNNATTFSGVPYTYQILQRLKFDSMNLPRLKYFTQAGGHLVNNVKKYFYETAVKNNYEFIVMYGQTEATARISYVPFTRLNDKLDSIGIPIPNGKLSIDSGTIFGENNSGEIIYKGPNVMLGYAENREDVFKPDELNNILYTGDMGYVDDEGFFYVTGRKKRFLKVFGNRVNLDDIERMIENKFHITTAVTGSDDNLLIIIESALNDQMEKIKKTICDSLSLHHSAIKIRDIDKIPISSNSKKDYQSIIKLFN